MFKLLASGIIVLICISGYSVTTKYINDFKYDNMENFEFSNITFIENSGIELAKESTLFYQSPETLWSLEKYGDSFLISSGSFAKLILLNQNTNKVVFSSFDQLLFSDMQVSGDKLYLSGIPKAKIFILDKKFNLVQEIAFSNQYIWNMVPFNKGFYVLTGNPAEIYYLSENNKPEYLARVSNENNLLKGIIIDDILYFSTDGPVFYKYSGGKVLPVASFDNPIADFTLINGKIYLISSSIDLKKGQPVQQPSAIDGDVGKPLTPAGKKNTGNKSVLCRLDLDGNKEEIYAKQNIRFLSVFQMGDSLIIGSDKNAGYLEIPIEGNSARFTSFGDGKFARFVQIGGATYVVLLEPSRILKIGNNYSKNGSFISTVFDCVNLSKWGKPIVSKTRLAGTDIKLFTRSSQVDDENYQEEWKPGDNKLLNAPGRFIQYKVELSSDGHNTPTLRSVGLPYVQYNAGPKIEKITFNYNNNGLRINWDASDDNKDILNYEVFIASADQEWVKITDKPIDESGLDFLKDNLPEGKYRIKIVVSDSPSNPFMEAKQGFKTAEYFYIDNKAPEIKDLKASSSAGQIILQWGASDSLSPLLESFYNINGGKWVKILPVDSIYDSLEEDFKVTIPELKNSYIQVKALDLFVNFSTKGVYLK